MDLMARRRMMIAKKALPYDAKVEYLESTGTQYIDTGIVLQELDIVQIDAMFKNKTGDNMLMGVSARLTGEGGVWIDVYGNISHYVRFGSSSSANLVNSAVDNMNVWRVYTIKKSSFCVDGIQIFTPNYVGTPSRNVFIFGRNPDTTKFVGRIRAAAISRDDMLILDLIPVRCGNIGYMYDRVSGQLFGNDGTGDFILGPDI